MVTGSPVHLENLQGLSLAGCRLACGLGRSLPSPLLAPPSPLWCLSAAHQPRTAGEREVVAGFIGFSSRL